jgi:flagellar hook-associated protein 1 FlgK
MFNEKNVFGTDSLYTISNISINSAVQEDYTKLPFRTLEGDNDMAKTQAMVEIWNKTFSNLDPNNMTQLNFKEYYNEIVYAMGNDGDLYDSISQSQNDAVIEVEDARTQVTGVSSEEELSNMIRFQSAYNASSRYVTAVAEMLEYLIMKLGA